MWVKYVGDITYNSLDVRDFQPNTSRSVPEEVGTYLIKSFPKLFSRSKEEVEIAKKVETPEIENPKEVKK